MPNDASFRAEVATAIDGIDHDDGAPLVAGFDGFVDAIIDVVDTRESPSSYSSSPSASDPHQRRGQEHQHRTASARPRSAGTVRSWPPRCSRSGMD